MRDFSHTVRNCAHSLEVASDTFQPENLGWIMELSYSHNNLAAVHLESGLDFDAETQAHVAEAVRLME